MKLRPSKERGATRISWLDSKHSFAFGDYYDRDNTSFGALRVLNEDKVKPASGFGEHSHRDMEILTYVLSGELAHKDSMGNGSVIKPGSMQRMTAGTGVAHSEWNHSQTEPVHFLQIWIIPESQGLTPAYEQKDDIDSTTDKWHVLASQNKTDSGVYLNQDLTLNHAIVSSGHKLAFAVEPGRIAWLQIISGRCTVNGTKLEAGDGLSIDEPGNFEILAPEADSDGRLLWFDLKG
ncbi:MAG: pirin family protein [Candidatus Obscuribacterales bacterium]|nr:pirin family protein [Candidatus Obscuribacterales bacterium]